MNKIKLIIGREFNMRVRKKSFILITILMPILLLALMVVPVLMQMYGGGASEARRVVVLDKSGVVADNLQSTEDLLFENSELSYQSALDSLPNVYGYLLVENDIIENPSNLTLYTSQSSTMSVEREIESQISQLITAHRIENSGVKALDSLMQAVNARAQLQTFEIVRNEAGEVSEKAVSSGVNMGVAYISSFMIYMFIFLYAMMVLNGVVEEKVNRVMEVMVSSVRPFELMMGKILGIACVALLQFLIWVVLIGVGLFSLTSFGLALPPEVQSVSSVLVDGGYLMKMIFFFLLYFVGGYLLYASMFAAVGSAVDNASDTQQLQLPVTIPLIISLLMMTSVMQEPNSQLAFWGSLIPFSSPIIMMARLSYDVPIWELILSILLLYGTFILMTYFAAKIYRVGIFMYGKKPTFKEILRWVKYKG